MLNVITLEDLWKQNIDGYLPVLLEIYNPDIAWTEEEKQVYGQEDSYIRFISDASKVVYKGKTYLPCNFTFSAPEVDGKKVGTASITISAIDVRVRKLLRSIKVPSMVTIVSVFAKSEKDNDSGKFIYQFAELNTKPFKMNSASSNRTTATFSLVFGKNMAQNVPYDMATPDRVPGAKG